MIASIIAIAEIVAALIAAGLVTGAIASRL
jgi:hypothetical protein